MIEKLLVFESTSFDPYYNLAIEKFLLESVPSDTCILYLWQNENTVVIGRNQNAWAECAISNLEADNVTLARRLSGGGAVYHDLGNLNFTFLATEENYDLDRQLSVIESMCHSFGISATRSGRNDILVDDKKFSGNAFYNAKGRCYHHGTLLIDADTAKMSKYLNPSKAKLSAKGVASVRSRVANLKEFYPDLTIEAAKKAMVQSFSGIYGIKPQFITLAEADIPSILSDAAKMGDWNWVYGAPLPCMFSCKQKFDWGEISCNLNIKSGIIKECQIFTDAMDWNIAAEIQNSLIGCRFAIADMQQAIQSNPKIADTQATDILGMLSDNL